MAYLCADRYSAYTGLTVTANATRTSGAAPLAVFFDATSSSDSSTGNPFHDLLYTWDFDDPGSGSFTYGNAVSRTTGRGPLACHVYETAGTYTPTVTVSNRYVSKKYTLDPIVVSSAASQWPTTQTICFSTDADFTGAPASSTNVNVTVTHGGDLAAAVAANIGTGNVRLLLKRGQTFTATTEIIINKAGPGFMGSIAGFGVGGNPIITPPSDYAIAISNAATPTLSDWRFVDMEMDGTAVATTVELVATLGGAKQLTFLRLDCHNAKKGLTLSTGILDLLNAVPFTVPPWDQIVVQDSVFEVFTGGSGGVGVYMQADRVGFLGNNVDDATAAEHCFRSDVMSNAVINSNTFNNAALGKLVFTLRSVDFLGSNSYPAGTYSDKVVISDNKFSGGATQDILCSMGSAAPQTIDARLRNQIWERNWFVAGAKTQNHLILNASYCTVRNNIFNASTGDQFTNAAVSPYQSAANSIPPASDRIWIYNNSYYNVENQQTLIMNLDHEATNDPATNVVIINNVGWSPNRSDAQMIYNPDAITYTGSDNSDNTQVRGATSPFTDTTPATPSAREFDPADYAVGSGAVVASVLDDFYGARRGYGNKTPVIDMGAVQTS